jgi:hypothetical protein
MSQRRSWRIVRQSRPVSVPGPPGARRRDVRLVSVGEMQATVNTSVIPVTGASGLPELLIGFSSGKFTHPASLIDKHLVTDGE